MQKQQPTGAVQDAVTAMVDEAGLLADLLAGNPVERSEFESLLEKPPAMSTLEQIVRTAIEIVQSGEFFPRHNFYYSPLRLGQRQPCGCAVAALYYAGHKLGFVEGELLSHSKSGIVTGLGNHISAAALDRVERGFEVPHKGHGDKEADGAHMIQCLNTMLEQKE